MLPFLLVWFVDDRNQTAFIELAYLFWSSGYRFPSGSHSHYVESNSYTLANRRSDQTIVPGDIFAKNKSCGKTLPSGLIAGAYPLVDVFALK